MKDVSNPTIDSIQRPNELPEERSFLQKCLDVVTSVRNRILGVDEPKGVANAEEQPKAKEYKVLDPQKITKLRMLCGTMAGEWIEAEDVVRIHETLRSLAGKEDEIDQFLRFDYTIIHQINEAREHEANLSVPLEMELDRIIASYVGRYLGKEQGETRSAHRFPVKVNLRKPVESAKQTELRSEPEADPSKVISFEHAKEVHAQHYPKPDPKPTVSEQPKPEKPEDDDLKVA